MEKTKNSTQPEPMWEAMDCPDVTDDPFYDFTEDKGDAVKLLSPCHKAPVWIFRPGKEEEPIICCSACPNEWDSDGDPIEKEVTGL